MTPGNPKMELRDPENQEDGDPEVRDGNKGRRERETERQRGRCREKSESRGTGPGQPQRDGEGNRRAWETEKHQRLRIIQTQGHTARPRPQRKALRSQEWGAQGERRMERERWMQWKGGRVVRVQTQPQ